MLIKISVDTNYCGMDEEYLVEVPESWSDRDIDNLAEEMAYDNAIEKGADEQARVSVEEGFDDMDSEDIYEELDDSEYDMAVSEAMGVWSSWEVCDEADRDKLIEDFGGLTLV